MSCSRVMPSSCPEKEYCDTRTANCESCGKLCASFHDTLPECQQLCPEVWRTMTTPMVTPTSVIHPTLIIHDDNSGETSPHVIIILGILLIISIAFLAVLLIHLRVSRRKMLKRANQLVNKSHTPDEVERLSLNANVVIPGTKETDVYGLILSDDIPKKQIPKYPSVTPYSMDDEDHDYKTSLSGYIVAQVSDTDTDNQGYINVNPDKDRTTDCVSDDEKDNENKRDQDETSPKLSEHFNMESMRTGSKPMKSIPENDHDLKIDTCKLADTSASNMGLSNPRDAPTMSELSSIPSGRTHSDSGQGSQHDVESAQEYRPENNIMSMSSQWQPTGLSLRSDAVDDRSMNHIYQQGLQHDVNNDDEIRFGQVMRAYDAYDARLNDFSFARGCLIGNDQIQIYVSDSRGLTSSENRVRNAMPSDIPPHVIHVDQEKNA